jgi:hypothetical protein
MKGKKTFLLSPRNLDKDYRNSICLKNMHKISLLWFSSCAQCPFALYKFFFYVTRKTFYWLWHLWSLLFFVCLSPKPSAILFHLCRSYLPIVSFSSDISSSFVIPRETRLTFQLSRVCCPPYVVTI